MVIDITNSFVEIQIQFVDNTLILGNLVQFRKS